MNAYAEGGFLALAAAAAAAALTTFTATNIMRMSITTVRIIVRMRIVVRIIDDAMIGSYRYSYS